MVVEKTFIMIKPEGVQRGIIGDVIQRFERRGYKIVAGKLLKPSEKLAEEHYKEHKSRVFFKEIVDNLRDAPVFAMIWEGESIVQQARKMIGATDPLESAPGTIRADHAITKGKNIIHGSDSVASASREINLWFNESEISEWDKKSDSLIY